MDITKHTPGPWTIPKPLEVHFGTPYTPIAASTLIAKVYSTAFGDHEQSLANARLMAAAPDLLAALKRADQFITNGIELGFIKMPDEGSDDPALETPDIVRAAITLAATP